MISWGRSPGRIDFFFEVFHPIDTSSLKQQAPSLPNQRCLVLDESCQMPCRINLGRERKPAVAVAPFSYPTKQDRSIARSAIKGERSAGHEILRIGSDHAAGAERLVGGGARPERSEGSRDHALVPPAPPHKAESSVRAHQTHCLGERMRQQPARALSAASEQRPCLALRASVVRPLGSGISWPGVIDLLAAAQLGRRQGWQPEGEGHLGQYAKGYQG